jgi:chaperonin GroEL (HSP60 family)
MPAEQPEVRLRVEAGVNTARPAAEPRVVPGGGAALLVRASALQANACGGEEGVGMGILAKVLGDPMRTLVRNAGFQPDLLLHEAASRGRGGASMLSAGCG